tara:strand:+ start:1113 stop:1826 length:714 start_codon:yes stop_codon:yes gene_type:complete
MLPIAILAGGLATRLHPITENRPKSLINIAGKPFIAHQLEYLSKQGFSNVVLCLGFLGEKICEFVGDGSRWRLNVMYSQDGPNLLDTGGAIKKALPLLGDEFFILYGDSYLPINFFDIEKFYKASSQRGLMTIYRNGDKLDTNNVDFEDGQIIEYNKELCRPGMTHIDYGLGLIHRSVFDAYNDNHRFSLSQVYNDLSLAGDLYGYEIFQRFYEIGSRQGIIDTNAFLSNKELKENL